MITTDNNRLDTVKQDPKDTPDIPDTTDIPVCVQVPPPLTINGHADQADPSARTKRYPRQRLRAKNHISVRGTSNNPPEGATNYNNTTQAVITAADAVNGVFDALAQDNSQDSPKRVLRPEPEAPKLHKVLAQSGMGSRLDMEQLILEGRISVNNEPAHIGQRIQYGDKVRVNGKVLRLRIDPPMVRVLAYHKPVGEVVTMQDPQKRPTVFHSLPRLLQGKWQAVGRLDLNTEGLLLFSNSGALTNQLMHPRFGLEREYVVRVLGALSAEEKQRLLDGIQLEDGLAQFQSIEESGGEGANCWYRVILTEGRNREVRRMFDALGHAVSRLIRIRYGAMALPKGLRRGTWMELNDHDVTALCTAAGIHPNAKQGKAHHTHGNNSNNAKKSKKPRNHQQHKRNLTQHTPPLRKDLRKGGKPSSSGRKGDPIASGIPNPLTTNTASIRKPSHKTSSPRNGNSQPDPMRTSLGYIGADSYYQKHQKHQKRRTSSAKPGARRGQRF